MAYTRPAAVEPTFPRYNKDEVYCIYCGLKISSPFQASGHAEGNGAWRGQCTGQYGCEQVTYFDWKEK